MKEKLCRQCKPYGNCFLKETMARITIPDIKDPDLLRGMTIEAEKRAAGFIEEAEKLGCPNVDTVKLNLSK